MSLRQFQCLNSLFHETIQNALLFKKDEFTVRRLVDKVKKQCFSFIQTLLITKTLSELYSPEQSS